MAFIELPKPELKKTKYADAKKCIFNRETGQPTTEECKQTFRNMGVED